MKAITRKPVPVLASVPAEVPVPAIVRTSRGVANSVQVGYAQWQRGMKQRARG